MTKKLSDDDVARMIGNRALKHLREMYPHVYQHLYQSCRLSLRNTIRNDVNSLIRAFRGDDRSQDMITRIIPEATDDAAGIEAEQKALSP